MTGGCTCAKVRVYKGGKWAVSGRTGGCSLGGTTALPGWFAVFHSRERASRTCSRSPRECRSTIASTLCEILCFASFTMSDVSCVTYSLLISSYLQLVIDHHDRQMECVCLLGREFAEGIFDDVTILEFGTNTAESKISQCGNVILRKGEPMRVDGL